MEYDTLGRWIYESIYETNGLWLIVCNVLLNETIYETNQL